MRTRLRFLMQLRSSDRFDPYCELVCKSRNEESGHGGRNNKSYPGPTEILLALVWGELTTELSWALNITYQNNIFHISNMVLLQTSEEWQRQSSLLLQARPTTVRQPAIPITLKHTKPYLVISQTRISVNYKVPNLSSPRYQKALNRKRRKTADDAPSDTQAPLAPKAMLCLKTFDPESGVCLKFQTDRAAEVGRLVNGMGKLGRHMAALPLKTEGMYPWAVEYTMRVLILDTQMLLWKMRLLRRMQLRTRRALRLLLG